MNNQVPLLDDETYQCYCGKCEVLFYSKNKRQLTCNKCLELLQEPSIFVSFRRLRDRVEDLENRLNNFKQERSNK